MPSDSSVRRLRFDGPSSCGVAALLLWSATVALARSLTEQLGPFGAAAAVQVAASVLCIASLVWVRGSLRRIRALPRSYLLGCGALFVAYMTFFYMAIGLASDRHQVLEIGLVNYLWCTLTILFSIVLLKKKATLYVVPGTVLALLGVFLVLTQGASVSWATLSANIHSNPTAYALALAGAVAWALYSGLTARLAGSQITGGVLVFIPVTGIVLLLLLAGSNDHGAWSMAAAAEVVILGLTTMLGYYLWDIAMSRGDVVLVAACSYFTPLLSTILSCAYLRVMPGASLWVGCLAIVAGSFMSWRSVSDRPMPQP